MRALADAANHARDDDNFAEVSRARGELYTAARKWIPWACDELERAHEPNDQLRSHNDLLLSANRELASEDGRLRVENERLRGLICQVEWNGSVLDEDGRRHDCCPYCVERETHTNNCPIKEIAENAK